MSKLILSTSLLLILKISSAQTANDKNTNIIAPYSVCINGLIEKDSLTTKELLEAGGVECCFAELTVISFTLAHGGNCFTSQGLYGEINSTSNRFTESMMTLIRRLPAGYPIWIDNIKAKNKRGDIFKLNPKTIHIVGNSSGK